MRPLLCRAFRGVTLAALLGLSSSVTPARGDEQADDLLDAALTAEAARIALIERAAPAAVCIFDEAEMGGGSGVLIDPAGYGLTNFHVVAEMLESRTGKGGLADGRLYDLHVLGIDPGGDVAMFRLTGRNVFPYAPLGDSGQVRVGDAVLAMGNPFVLSDDYTPTVTAGIVSGVNRYQYGEGDALLYSDCIQVDASINPGNSGGPLFNMAGEVIGINGRISVSMRGRVNVGLGYAITTNQIRAFLPTLRAGLLAEHGTLQAVARDMPDGTVKLVELLEDGPAWKLGARAGDVLLQLDGRDIPSANAFASIMGTLPANWPVVMVFRNADGVRQAGVIRTEALKQRQLEAKFTPDAAVNLDAVERAVQRFRSTLATPALLGDAVEVQREGHRPGRYRVAQAAGDELQLIDEGDSGMGFTITAQGAEALSPAGAQPLPMRIAMAWQGLWAANRAASLADRESLSAVRHRGADRLLEIDSNGQILADEILESIELPLAEQTVALLQFAQETHRLRRVRTIDRLTGDEVDLDFEAADRPRHVRARDRHGEIFSLELQAGAEIPPAAGLAESPQAEPAATRELADLMAGVQARVVKLVGAQVGRSAGYGSGIMVSSNGLILTIDSGLLDGASARAVLADGTVRAVEIVSADRQRQLALVRLRAPEGAAVPADYPYFALDDAPTVSPGERVLAAGNPFKVAAGAEPVSVAMGVYCGTTRLDASRGTQDVPYRGEVLLIDAITSTPGFAGGALVNAEGRLLGLIGRSVEARTTFTNLNYAVPREVLRSFVAAALEGGTGPATETTPPPAPVYHGIKFFELGYRTNPVYVERIRRGSPAARAGLRKDDLIIGANNAQITSLAAMEQVLEACRPGDTLDLTVLRGNDVKRISIELEAAP